MYLRSRQPLSAEDVSKIFGLLCHNLLGHYEYSDGNTRPAVRIGKGKKQSKVYGIECTVSPTPDIRDRNEFWTIFFADTTNNNYQKMRNIVQILQNNILNIQSLKMLGRNDQLEIDDQIILVVDRGQLEVLRERFFPKNN
jgi:hypothetical protein